METMNNQEFMMAVDKNDLATVQRLLPEVDPAINGNEAIGVAARNGYTEMVQLLMADPRVDSTANSNWAIQQAMLKGHLEVVNLLLTDPRLDPSANNNWLIEKAALEGYV